MKKIYEFTKTQKPTKGEIGLEIECEGRNLNQDAIPPTWRCENDGSLRGGFPHACCEYVLAAPLHPKDAKKAIVDLIGSQPDAKYNFSFRTSVHTHLNVGECTELEVLNIIYTYYLIEEPLLNFCGRERKGNRFCLRLQDAEGIIDIINQYIRKGAASIRAGDEGNIRYAALNLAALTKYGSLEFRSMRGTLDKAVLNRWIDAIISIKAYALSKKTPVDIYEDYMGTVGKGHGEFLKKVLKEDAPFFDYPKLAQDMARSFSLSIDLPHLFKIYGQWMLKETSDADKLKEAYFDGGNGFVAAAPPNGAGVQGFDIRMDNPIRAVGERVRPIVVDDVQGELAEQARRILAGPIVEFIEGNA